jgi:hypothetical protein
MEQEIRSKRSYEALFFKESTDSKKIKSTIFSEAGEGIIVALRKMTGIPVDRVFYSLTEKMGLQAVCPKKNLSQPNQKHKI